MKVSNTTEASRSRPGAKKDKSRSTTTEVNKSGESGDKKTKAATAGGPGAKIAGGGSSYDFHKGYVSCV